MSESLLLDGVVRCLALLALPFIDSLAGLLLLLLAALVVPRLWLRGASLFDSAAGRSIGVVARAIDRVARRRARVVADVEALKGRGMNSGRW